MKYKIICFFLSFGFFYVTSAQVINVPDKAQKHFQDTYKGAKDVKWKNNVANYQADYKMNGMDCTAHYNIDGTWDYTEVGISTKKIPADAKEAFSKSKYRDWDVKSIVRVDNSKGEKLYRFEARKGIEKKYVFFDKDGVIIKENVSL